MRVDFSGEEIKIYDFDELEAYRIARKMEGDGIYYYSRMKDEMLKPAVREIVEMLLADEKSHLSLFDEQIERLAGEDDAVDDETLADIVDSKVMDVLKDSGQVSEILCNPQEAVRLGISVEERSIAFYQALLHQTEDSSGKAVLEQLVKEEQSHVEKLRGLLRK